MRVGKHEMMRRLVSACPSFMDTWHVFQADWPDDLDPPYYLALADLARHIAAHVVQDDTTELPALFAAVEQLLHDGDEYVHTALVVGLLEDLQTPSFYPPPLTPAHVVPYLGPTSRAWWVEVDAYWHRQRRYIGEGYQQPDR